MLMTIATPSTAGAVGMSRSGLYRAARAGRFERTPGVFTSPPTRPRATGTSRRPDAPICLVSALAHHDLTDTIPDRLDVAIPRGARPPVTDAAIAWHRFDRSTFDVGRGTLSVGGTDTEIGLYSPERCIADAFRLRGLIGYETARDVLKEWLRRGGRPTSLIEVAALLPRTRTPILHALEVLS